LVLAEVEYVAERRIGGDWVRDSHDTVRGSFVRMIASAQEAPVAVRSSNEKDWPFGVEDLNAHVCLEVGGDASSGEEFFHVRMMPDRAKSHRHYCTHPRKFSAASTLSEKGRSLQTSVVSVSSDSVPVLI
jgi:hypothetical protein